jgi:competence ComEA-like helix-hairpin-helix protein
MFCLTADERKVLIWLGVLILVGAALRFFYLRVKTPLPLAVNYTFVRPVSAPVLKPININKASAVDFDRLPGIGLGLAQRIIDYRDQQGNFTSIEDIKNVSGIGEKKFQAIEKYLSL